MDRRRSPQRQTEGSARAFLKSYLTDAMTAVAVALPLAMLSTLPGQLLLLVLSLLAIGSAGLIGLVAWRLKAERAGPRVTGWDISGALMLIGFAAGMLSDPTSVTELFGLVPMS